VTELADTCTSSKGVVLNNNGSGTIDLNVIGENALNNIATPISRSGDTNTSWYQHPTVISPLNGAAANVTPNAYAGRHQTINVTTNGAFRVNAPTIPRPGYRLTLDIKISSGGAMGAITWNAAFKLAGSFINPANTLRRTIDFYYDGTNWIEQSRAAADI
jgi:hypothetical protein